MTHLLEELRSTTGQMVDLLGEIVSAESPTQDFDATASCSRVVSGAGTGLLVQEPERIEIEGRTHLRWRFGDRARVLVLGHFDTVWPIGTIDRWPFSVEADNASGPGVFDMKAGIVQGLFAVQALDSPEGVEILFTSDEEVGSPTSRPIIEEAARQVAGVLVLEPSFGGALKVARKGVSGYSIDVEGRAAHAGLEPDMGYNALVELAHQVIAVAKIARPEVGTTLTPTVASAGTARNTVPAQARFYVDVRATTTAEQQRVDSEITKLSPAISGTQIKVGG
ncbi:MAG: M20/M25/M40 family metallo-hydrolase, partial [Actinomycetota bacterium]